MKLKDKPTHIIFFWRGKQTNILRVDLVLFVGAKITNRGLTGRPLHTNRFNKRQPAS